MSNSTTRPAIAKPQKPRPDFPLFPHATKRWAKKIRGKLHYFGSWADGADSALQKYLDQKDDLHAGRTPRTPSNELTIRELVNRFLTSKRRQVDANELAERTFLDYHRTCRGLGDTFRLDRLVEDLGADDFERLRAGIAKTRGPAALGVEITRCRVIFKYAFDNLLVKAPVRYGSGFKKPSKATLRKARNGNGPRMFEADEIRRLVDAADVQLRAMILLGINAALGNADCGRLPKTALDLDGGWITYARGKTGIQRRCALWPETIQALRAAIAARPNPKHKQHAGLVFLYRSGSPWTDSARNDNRVSTAFRQLARKLGMYRPGVGFYALRHTFETIGGESIDQVAVDHVMGHSRGDMASVYRERISDQRLQAVVDHVRKWVFNLNEKE